MAVPRPNHSASAHRRMAITSTTYTLTSCKPTPAVSSTSVKRSTPPLGPGRLCIDSELPSPRRVFQNITYPKRLTKPAAEYLSNLQALFAAYVPWMTHLTLCVYHIWALIFALCRSWTSPLWVASKPLVYCCLLQRCFLSEAIRIRLAAHNWRGENERVVP